LKRHAQLSISAFLIARYRQGDEPPRPELPTACWYTLATSLASILLCVIAPAFKILRKTIYVCWGITFGLWVGATFWNYRAIGWKEEYGEQYDYCDE
jgi:hypothetical protein